MIPGARFTLLSASGHASVRGSTEDYRLRPLGRRPGSPAGYSGRRLTFGLPDGRAWVEAVCGSGIFLGGRRRTVSRQVLLPAIGAPVSPAEAIMLTREAIVGNRNQPGSASAHAGTAANQQTECHRQDEARRVVEAGVHPHANSSGERCSGR